MLRSDTFLGKTVVKCFCSHTSTNGIRRFYINFTQRSRHKSGFSRIAKRVYVPNTDGQLAADESMARLPVNKQPDVLERSKTSGELFKSLMGDIYSSRNKSLIAVEGGRQVNDAISFGLKPKIIFLLKSLKTFPDNVLKIVEGNSESSPTEVHRINLSALQEWSSVKTPPGIIGIFDKPTSVVQQATNLNKQKLPLMVVLDNIREPGNLGSIMRTAAGLGCKMLMSRGCVDPWDTKSLRGGNGAQFLVPMITKVDLQYLHQHIPLPELTPLKSNEPIECVNDLNDEKKADAASGIGVFLADSGEDLDEFEIPIVDYTSVQYSKLESIVVILGGETSGLSKIVKKSANELRHYYPEDIKHISRIKIPMSLPIDSLNVANAFGIIGYEILRQIASSSKM